MRGGASSESVGQMSVPGFIFWGGLGAPRPQLNASKPVELGKKHRNQLHKRVEKRAMIRLARSGPRSMGCFPRPWLATPSN